jgi:hypothetical protein
MKQFPGAYWSAKVHQWDNVFVDFDRVEWLRTNSESIGYKDFFHDGQRTGYYALYSVAEGAEFFFEDPEVATEFRLRFL